MARVSLDVEGDEKGKVKINSISLIDPLSWVLSDPVSGTSPVKPNTSRLRRMPGGTRFDELSDWLRVDWISHLFVQWTGPASPVGIE